MIFNFFISSVTCVWVSNGTPTKGKRVLNEQFVWALKTFFFPDLISVFELIDSVNATTAHFHGKSLVVTYWLNNASCTKVTEKTNTESRVIQTLQSQCWYRWNMYVCLATCHLKHHCGIHALQLLWTVKPSYFGLISKVRPLEQLMRKVCYFGVMQYPCSTKAELILGSC